MTDDNKSAQNNPAPHAVKANDYYTPMDIAPPAPTDSQPDSQLTSTPVAEMHDPSISATPTEPSEPATPPPSQTNADE